MTLSWPYDTFSRDYSWGRGPLFLTALADGPASAGVYVLYILEAYNWKN
jgi:hypothetical protein